jgi:hypothetical protein
MNGNVLNGVVVWVFAWFVSHIRKPIVSGDKYPGFFSVKEISDLIIDGIISL